jgi:hypothetical protein
MNGRHPIRSKYKFRGAECLNCGAPLDLVDKYCHQCSQLNSTKRLKLKDFFLEFLAGVVSYDSRTWRSIKDLLFKPGKVTREYVQGRRMSYANPFRFFLSVCIIYFLLLQLLGSLENYGIYNAENGFGENAFYNPEQSGSLISIDTESKDLDTVVDERMLAQANKEALDEIRRLEAGNLVEQRIAKAMREELEKQRTLLGDSSTVKLNNLRKYKSQSELDTLGYADRFFKQTSDFIYFIENRGNLGYEKTIETLKLRDSRFNKFAFERSIAMERFENDPAAFAQSLFSKLPIFLFLFTPVFALIFRVFYRRKNFNYMEHLVFVFNIKSFVFLSLIIMLIIDEISWGYVDLSPFFFLLIAPFYFYKSMRNFYRQRRRWTIPKFLIINFVYGFLLTLGFALLAVIGIATF